MSELPLETGSSATQGYRHFWRVVLLTDPSTGSSTGSAFNGDDVMPWLPAQPRPEARRPNASIHGGYFACVHQRQEGPGRPHVRGVTKRGSGFSGHVWVARPAYVRHKRSSRWLAGRILYELFVEIGFVQGMSSACVFVHQGRGLVCTVHGDGFTTAGTKLSLVWFE